MPSRHKPLQSNFSSGEIAPDLLLRRDTQQYHDGAKSLLNRRCLIGGGTARRPGSWWYATLPGDPRFAEWVVDAETRYIIVFSSGRMDAYLPGGIPAGSLTNCPWTNIWQDMDHAQSANTMFLTHPGMTPQVITRTGVTTWALASFAFLVGLNGRIQQPYYKVAAGPVTIRPSALTGNITLLASGPIFNSAHVSARFRYLGREVVITAVTDSTHANATVIEELPATQVLTLVAAGPVDPYIPTGSFAIGDVVQGSLSGAKGEVTAVDGGSSQLTVAIITGLTKFIASSGSTKEEIIGPNGRSKIATIADTSPAAMRNWDEQLFSPYRGYPGTVELHRNRIIFGGHPLIPSGLIGSTPVNLYDFDVGEGGDGDGFFETIGDAQAAQIVSLHSAEQLLVFTDVGPYYIPETAANPLRPSSISFVPFGSAWGINHRTRPRAFDGGVIFSSGSLVIKAKPTGDAQRMWDAEEVSLLAHHLIKTPIDMSVCSNFAGGVERYAVIVNSDGTLAVMQLVEDQKLRNFTPWDTNGIYRTVACLGSDIYVGVVRTIGGATVHLLEKFDPALTLDAATAYVSTTALAGVATKYPGVTVNVVVQASTWHLGTYPLPANVGDIPAGTYIAGLDYVSVIETLPPDISDDRGSRAGDLMRILSAEVHVQSSARFAAQGYELNAYQVGDDMTQPPPVKDGPEHFGFLGWAREPTIRITQNDPLPLNVLGIRMEVAV